MKDAKAGSKLQELLNSLDTDGFSKYYFVFKEIYSLWLYFDIKLKLDEPEHQ